VFQYVCINVYLQERVELMEIIRTCKIIIVKIMYNRCYCSQEYELHRNRITSELYSELQFLFCFDLPLLFTPVTYPNLSSSKALYSKKL
jgi:hypothetical protein